MSVAAATARLPRSQTDAGPRGGTIAGLLLGLFVTENVLLLRFLGVGWLPTILLIAVSAGVLWRLCAPLSRTLAPLPWPVLGLGLLISLALFTLGGEGHLFYSNVDWQIRDAVLRDLANNAWPFSYLAGTERYILRAPLGMYLAPALFGQTRDLALLVCNSLHMALLLALGWHLFETNRQRLTVLGIFLAFSGWDVVGTALYDLLGARPSWDHLEQWNAGYQYSANLTQLFWVPQHAIAGWTCAVAFLLWRKGIAPLGLFVAVVPLVALWSPLSIMGAMPFALLAGIDALRRRTITRVDVALGVSALAVSVPALWYLHLDAAQVSLQVRHPRVWILPLCILLEVAPFALPLLSRGAAPESDRRLVGLSIALLALMPLLQIGANSDFQMRASIMPLAILAIEFGNWFGKLTVTRPLPRSEVAYAVFAVAIGATTPAFELKRAFVNDPSPPPLCSLIGVWDKQDNMIVPYSTYLARLGSVPAAIRARAQLADQRDPVQCWDRAWAKIK